MSAASTKSMFRATKRKPNKGDGMFSDLDLPDKSQHRKPAPRMVRLIIAYLSGYRPDDWPEYLTRTGFLGPYG